MPVLQFKAQGTCKRSAFFGTRRADTTLCACRPPRLGKLLGPVLCQVPLEAVSACTGNLTGANIRARDAAMCPEDLCQACKAC